MDGFDGSQFGSLTGRSGKHHKRMVEKKQEERMQQNREYEEKYQKHTS